MPQAILLQDVERLANAEPWSMCRPAICATSSSRASWPSRPRSGSMQAATRRREAAARAEQEAADRARENAALLSRTVLTIQQQAGDDGRLFGSVTTQDIADAIREARGIRIDRRKIHLDEPIRHTGTYMVVVEVVDDVTATVKTMVVAG